jgi:hypothetical protein
MFAYLRKKIQTTTYTNAITTHALRSAYIPIVAESGRQALQAALATLRSEQPRAPWIVRIKTPRILKQYGCRKPTRNSSRTAQILKLLVLLSPSGSIRTDPWNFNDLL